MAKTVGMTCPIKLEWLDKTVELIIDGKDKDRIRKELTEYLLYEITSPTILGKTRATLTNIWVNTPDKLIPIKQQALEAYKNDGSDKLALHWSMMLVAYPVFCDVCALIGKLSTIQDTFNRSWLNEKLFEIWGERETLIVSSNKILQTLKQIGVIRNEKVGVYRINMHPITDGKTIQVLLSAILSLKKKAYYEVAELPSIPLAFPFEYTVSHELLHNSGLFTLNYVNGNIMVSVD